MKVLASTLAGLALAQDRWTGFDYDYGFGSAERNQISQSQAAYVMAGQGAGQDLTAGSATIAAASTLSTLFNPYATGQSGSAYLGNGMMCWFCDADSVYSCFNSGQFQVCYGQDYFCYFHERRKIGHYFNRREKYIDNFASTNTDLFLVRVNNEAWNLDSLGLPNSMRNPDSSTHTDDLRPATDIHVMAGCQQPQACLRQQMQNQAINIGVAFYGNDANAEVGNIQSGSAGVQDFRTYIHPTSRRNVREGLCRIGKDWTYYSGKLWHYDDGGQYETTDADLATSTTPNGCAPDAVTDLFLHGGHPCALTVHTIDQVNSVPIQMDDDTLRTTSSVNEANAGNAPMDDASSYNVDRSQTGEATAVYGRNDNGTPSITQDDIPSGVLWGRGIYDAHDIHGHQFWHERESWYNGMRPNGFPEQHYHGGKGSESVCHFCCNPASSDGMFCNRRLLDSTAAASATAESSTAADTSSNNMGMEFSSGIGNWYKADTGRVNDVTNGIVDHRNQFVDPDYVRADNPSLLIMHTPMANSYNTDAAWLSEHRFHGMFRNPETQVSQDYIKPLFT